MTLRSLKGTLKTNLTELTRSLRASIYDNAEATASLKDNPINLSLFHDLENVKIQALAQALIELGDTANEFIAFDKADAITNVGSVYTVNREFYIVGAGHVFRVNTGSDTEADTIRLEISATEYAMFQTVDIADGTTVASFEGTSTGDGVVNVANIRWLGEQFRIDAENGEIDLGANVILKADNTYAIGSASFAPSIVHGHNGRFDEIYDLAGTAAPTFPEGLKSSEAVILPESNGEAIYIAEFFQSFADNVTENLFTFTKTANNSGNGTQVIIGGSITFVGYTTETGSGRYVQTMTRIPIMIHFRSNANASLVTGTAETIQVTSNLSTTFTLSLSTANTTTAVLAVTINVSGGVNGNVPAAAPYMAILDIGQAGGGTFNSLCTVTKSGT